MNEKEGQIALFMNVLQERQQQILQAQRQIINYHLGRDFVARHLHNNLAKCRYSRATQDTADRPSFFFISEISSSFRKYLLLFMIETKKRFLMENGIFHTNKWLNQRESLNTMSFPAILSA